MTSKNKNDKKHIICSVRISIEIKLVSNDVPCKTQGCVRISIQMNYVQLIFLLKLFPFKSKGYRISEDLN